MFLRDLVETDRAQLLAWRNLPEVRENMFTDHVIGQNEHNEWFASLASDATRKYWIITDGLHAAGLAAVVGICQQHRRCSWVFYLGRPESRGTGLSAVAEFEVIEYVFGALKCHKLCCEVLAFNKTVIRTHERFGFKHDGVLREHIQRADRYIDVITMSLLDVEWVEKRAEMNAFVDRIIARLNCRP